jgi:hypothetical protein
MTLLDNYLDAVRSLLPRAQRADIVAELRDALLSQVEDEQRVLGRDLTDTELARILQRFGPPEAVGARYTPPRYLIGPEIYPDYVFWVKVVMGILGAMVLALVALSVTAGEPLRSVGRVLWSGTLIVAGNLIFVTLVFVFIDRATRKLGWSTEWDARDLLQSRENITSCWTFRPTRPARRTSVPRTDAIVGLCASTFWLVWWTDVLPINGWLLWSRLPLEPAPIWNALTPLALMVIAGHMILQGLALVRPRAVLLYEVASLLLGVGLLALVVRALAGGPLVVVTNAELPAAPLAGLLNVMGWIGLVVVAVIAIASIVVTIVRWIVQEPRRDDAMTTA